MKKLLVILALVPTMAHAGFLTGNELYSRMNSTDTSERIYALGYLVGVYDASEAVDHCSSGGVTAGQIRDVVKQYMDNNPSIRHFMADILVRVALGKAWPCAKKGKGA